MFLQKILITTKALNNALKSGSEDLSSYYLDIGIQPNTDSLNYACKLRSFTLVQKILLCKITPENGCIQNLFENYYYYTGGQSIITIIDLLIQYGYKITYNDVLLTLTKKCKIHNVKKYNIAFDNKFIEKCAEIGYYPYTKEEIGVEPTLECLRIECGRANNLTF